MAANETPVGAPGGTSGPASATGATFVVNDKSLRSLIVTFQALNKEVGKFNASLIALDKGGKALDKIQAQLATLGVGSGTVGSPGSSGSTTTPATFTNGLSTAGGSAGGTVTRSTTTNQLVSSGGGGGSGSNSGWGNLNPFGKAISVGGTLALAGGSYVKRSMGDISDMDLMYTQSTLSGGRGFSQSQYLQNQRFAQGIGGYQSASDLIGGVSTIQSALGAGLGNARTNGVLSQVGQLAALNPSAGLSGSAAGASSLYNPVTQNRLRAAGAIQSGQGGKLQSPQQIYQAIQKLVFRGQKVTADMIGEGMQPGAPLYRTLVGLGLDDNAMEQFRMYALVQANLGGDANLANKALQEASKGQRTSLTKLAGLDSIRQNQNTLAGAKVRQQGETMDETAGTLKTTFSALADVTNQLTDAFRGLNSLTHGGSGMAIGASSFIPGASGGIGGVLGNLGGHAFNLETIGLGGVVGAARGMAGRLFTKGGGAAGRAAGGLSGAASGALGASGLMGTPVYVTNMPSGGFGGGGGGIGGGGESGLGPNDTGMMHGPEQEGRLARYRRVGTTGLRDFAGGLRGGISPVGAAGDVGYGGTGMVPGAAMSSIGAGVAGGAVLAAPFAAAAYAVDKIHGQVVKNSVINQDSAGSTSGSLTDMIKNFRTEGYMSIPAAAAEWHNTVEPAIRAASAESNPSKRADKNVRAVHLLAQLMGKYKNQLSALNGSKGMGASGSAMLGSGAQQTMSYSIGNPGGAAVGVGGGANAAKSTKPSAASSEIAGIIQTAESYQGMMYKWGGSNPKTSFDCSGLMQWSFGQHGIKLPRRARDQQQVGTAVPNDQIVPGDLLFYGKPAHHVTLYVGNGQMMEAPETGKPLRVTKVRPFTDARRMLGGGASVSVNASDFVQSGSQPQGDSGTGPATVASSNLSQVGSYSSEADALSALMSGGLPAGAGAGGGVSAQQGSGGTVTAASATASGSGTSNGNTPPSGPPPGGTVGQWVQQALGLLHLDFDKYGSAIATIIQHESSGNPRAINNWDSNAKAGHPSKGIMQTIDSTFKQYELPGHTDIWNPVDNIAAATRYAIARYGSLDNVPGIKSLNSGGPYKGYSQGSYQTAEGMAYLHGDEMVVPASSARKVRAMIARQGSRVQSDASTAALAMSSQGMRPSVTIQAPVTVVGSATQKDAQDFLSMVKQQIEQEDALNMVGSG